MIRSYAHWKPRYMFARGREILDHKLKPSHPWLTSQSVTLLDELLKPSDIALEYGSGRSTFWIAGRVQHVTSIEHDATWFRRGVETQKDRRISNIELRHIAMDSSDKDGANSPYVRALDSFELESLDFCLVDGMYRGHCALGVLPKIKRGGLIAIDNAGWFLPSSSRCPNARALGAGPMDAVWQRVMDETASWRRIWTSSDVTDTVIMFKP